MIGHAGPRSVGANLSRMGAGRPAGVALKSVAILRGRDNFGANSERA